MRMATLMKRGFLIWKFANLDEQSLKSYGVKSYVELTNEQKYKIAKEIRHTYYAGYKQMIRCLAIKDVV